MDRPKPRDQRRRPLRLKSYDYAQAGVYFVTIVVQGRSCLFGEVAGEDMRLNGAGQMARRVWQALPRRFPTIDLDTFVVMPNHIHGIIGIDTSVGAPLVGAQGSVDQGPGTQRAIRRENQHRATTRVAPTGGGRYVLGDVVGAYKSLATVEYVRGVEGLGWPPFHGRLWQRNYYEHIVRNDESLRRIRRYVLDNPARWSFDRENPLAVKPEDL